MFNYTVAVFVLGTIIGSFLNVVIFRYNTGRKVNGRSFCASCGQNLRWFELIPILSYLFLLGRCVRCKSKISIQYPLVELGTGLLFLLIFSKYFFSLSTIYYLIIFSILIIIFVYDLQHKIIPDLFVFSFITLTFIGLFINFENLSFVFPSLINLLSGPAIFFFFFSLWFLSKGKWMGFGDAKLVLGIGWLLGMVLGISAIVLSFWIGAICGILILIFQKIFINSNKITLKSEIPFGPFLIIGTVIVFFCQYNVLSISWFF